MKKIILFICSAFSLTSFSQAPYSPPISTVEQVEQDTLTPKEAIEEFKRLAIIIIQLEEKFPAEKNVIRAIRSIKTDAAKWRTFLDRRLAYYEKKMANEKAKPKPNNELLWQYNQKCRATLTALLDTPLSTTKKKQFQQLLKKQEKYQKQLEDDIQKSAKP